MAAALASPELRFMPSHGCGDSDPQDLILRLFPRCRTLRYHRGTCRAQWEHKEGEVNLPAKGAGLWASQGRWLPGWALKVQRGPRAEE